MLSYYFSNIIKMVDESQILTLMEMGFAREQAIEALENTNNDLTKAIAFLFGEVDEPQGTGTEQEPINVDSQQEYGQYSGLYDSYPTSTVSLSNPQDLPEFLHRPTSPISRPFHNPNQPSTEFIENRHVERNDSSSSSSSSNNDVTMDSDSSSFDDIPPNVKGPGHLVPVILSRMPGFRYWIPIVSILCHNKQFVEAVLGTQLKQPQSDSLIDLEEPKVTPDKETAMESSSSASTNASLPEFDFVEELKKIVSFVQNFHSSHEWYISADNLFRSVPVALRSDEYMMSEEEIIVNVFKCIMQKIPDSKPLLESFVESTEEEITKGLTVLEIDVDTRKTNVYETLNELFWQRGFSKLGSIKYQSVAPVVTLHLMADDSNYATPFTVDEKIYPEIYGERVLPIIQREVDKMQEAEQERRGVSKNLMDLNVFEGKRLTSVLRQTTDAVGTVLEEAQEDLTQLTKKLEEMRNNDVQKQRELTDLILGKHMRDFSFVHAEVGDLKSYELQGVIFSDSFYYFRSEGAWVKMESGEIVDFERLAADVSVLTRRGTQPVTLVYAEQKASEEGGGEGVSVEGDA